MYKKYSYRRIKNLGLFIFIILLHCFFLLFITQHSSYKNRASQSAIQLVLLPQQIQKINEPEYSKHIKSQVAIAHPQTVKPHKLPNRATNYQEAILSNVIMKNEVIDMPESTSLPPLNIDVTSITKGMKKEFEQGEKSNYKSKYKTFSSSIASTYVAKQNGVQIEQIHAFDGRPISKVTTPNGTYCIRHYKPGEKLEMTPPSIPMTCGNY